MVVGGYCLLNTWWVYMAIRRSQDWPQCRLWLEAVSACDLHSSHSIVAVFREEITPQNRRWKLAGN